MNAEPGAHIPTSCICMHQEYHNNKYLFNVRYSARSAVAGVKNSSAIENFGEKQRWKVVCVHGKWDANEKEGRKKWNDRMVNRNKENV